MLILDNFITTTNYIDENGNNEETDTQNKDYNLENSEVLLSFGNVFAINQYFLSLYFFSYFIRNTSFIEICTILNIL